MSKMEILVFSTLLGLGYLCSCYFATPRECLEKARIISINACYKHSFCSITLDNGHIINVQYPKINDFVCYKRGNYRFRWLFFE